MNDYVVLSVRGLSAHAREYTRNQQQQTMEECYNDE